MQAAAAPPPLILRERPPTPPPVIPSETSDTKTDFKCVHMTLINMLYFVVIRQIPAPPPPPRSVIIERFPPAPERPRKDIYF